MSKRCTKCGEIKPLGEFGRRKDSPDGRRNECRACRAESARQYRLANLDRLREQQHDRYQQDRERVLERNRAYYLANRDRILAWHSRWRVTNKEYIVPVKLTWRANTIDAVFGHYGRSCACCGTTEDLQIDHVNGDGAEHRRQLFGDPDVAGWRFYRKLINAGFPDGFQTLCRACNSSKQETSRCRLIH